MSTLKIPVTSITDEGCVFDERVRVSSIQPPGTEALPVETVTVSGRFERLGEEYLFRGHVIGEYEGACVRCLQPSLMPFDVEVAWLFTEGAGAVLEEIAQSMDMTEDDSLEDDPKDAYRSFQGHEIDLSACAWEEIVFAQPSRYLCQEECKGLCPHCGMNLNTGACHCADDQQEEPIGNRGLAVLAELFPELAPEKTKE